MIRVIVVAMLLCALPNTLVASDERQHLRSIAKELINLQRLVELSRDVAGENTTRLTFDYAYVSKAIGYLERSVSNHVSRIEATAPPVWDLNRRSRLTSTTLELDGDSHTSPDYIPESTERGNLNNLAQEIERIRNLINKSGPDRLIDDGPMHFDYDYALEVLVYIEYAIRSHLSLQNSLPRTQWDTKRYERLTSGNGNEVNE